MTFEGSAAAPTITISGSGFGVEPPATSNAELPNLGLDYGTSLHLTDRTNVPLFDAGYDDPAHGYHDLLGLIVLSYSDDEITFTLGSNYGNSEALFSVLQFNPGDQFTTYVRDASFSGTVEYAPEPGFAGVVGIGVVWLVKRYRLLQSKKA